MAWCCQAMRHYSTDIYQFYDAISCRWFKIIQIPQELRCKGPLWCSKYLFLDMFKMLFIFPQKVMTYINCLMWKRHISIACAQEARLVCIDPSICPRSSLMNYFLFSRWVSLLALHAHSAKQRTIQRTSTYQQNSWLIEWCTHLTTRFTIYPTYPDNKVHRANAGSTLGRHPHVGPMNFAIRGDTIDLMT